MALNNEFKVKNDLNTLGRILSGGQDIADIFAASNTSWTLSANNGTFAVAGGDTLSVQGGNGVDVRVGAGTDTLRVSGIDATTSVKGVASFNSASFAVTNGDVTVKSSGISNAQLAGSITDDKLNTISTAGKVANSATTATSANTPNTIVLRDNSGGFNVGAINASGTVSTPTLSTPGGTSTQWNSNYTTVRTTSASWNNAFNTGTAYQLASSSFADRTSVATATGTLLPTSIYQNASGNWQGTFTTVQNTSASWNNAFNTGTAYQLASSSFATNTLLQSTSALLTPLTVTRTLTGQLVTNTDFGTYRTSVATSTATLLPTTIYQNASGNWQGTFTTVQSNSGNWQNAYNTATTYQLASGGFALSGYNTTISDTVSSVTVGGASPLAASEWKQKTIIQALDTILFPDLAPTYTIPTISIGSNITNGFDYEVGTVISPLLTITAVRNDAGGYSALYFQRNNSTINTVTNPTSSTTTNVADQYGYTNPNNPNSIYQPTYTDTNFSVPLNQTTWRAMGDYRNGKAKKNNKGVDDTRAFAVRSANAPQLSATSFTSSTVSVDGFYRRWVGSLSALPGNSALLRTSSTLSATSLDTAAGNLAATPIFINQKIIAVLVPSTRTLTSVVTESNENITGNFSLSSIVVPDAGGTNQSYRLYYYEGATALNGFLTTVSIT